MRRSIVLLVATALIGIASAPALARSPAGSGGGGFSHGSAQPPSNNSAASANSNGRFAEDRQTGLDRANERRSAQGTAHEQATTKAPAGDTLEGKPAQPPLQTPTPQTK